MNSTRARILRGLPDGVPVPAELVLRSGQRHLREVLRGSVTPRVLARPNGRSPDPDWRRPLDQDDATFSRQVAALLEAHRLAGDYGTLAIFAAPEVLELLHEIMPRGLRDRVVAEVDENLIALPEPVLQQRVAADLRRI